MAAAESVPKRGKAERGGYLLACNPRNYGVPDEWYHLKFDMYIMQDYHINAYVDTGFRTVFTSGLNNFTDSLEVLEENYLRINGLSDLTSYVPGFHAEYTTSRPLLEGLPRLRTSIMHRSGRTILRQSARWQSVRHAGE